MAKILATSLPQLWLDIIESPDMDLRFSLGTIEDLNAQRSAVATENGTRGFCTQALLMRLGELGVISKERYSLLVAKLLQHGYWYVVVDASDLLHVARADNYVLTDDFRAIAKALSMPCELGRVVDIVIEFMTCLWLGGIPLTTSDDFLLVLLEQMCVLHQPDQSGCD